MRRVCAWCGGRYGDSADKTNVDDAVTHGICGQCAKFFSAHEPDSLRGFLNVFSEPILCVDSDARVLTANDAACDLLQEDRSTISDLLFGQVALCPWSMRAPGCGQHEHCLACTVRTMVGETFAAKTGVLRQPAYVEHTLSDGTVQRLRIVVTSEYRGEMVLIRIDDLAVDEES
jgi:PAS domain-containing protein